MRYDVRVQGDERTASFVLRISRKTDGKALQSKLGVDHINNSKLQALIPMTSLTSWRPTEGRFSFVRLLPPLVLPK